MPLHIEDDAIEELARDLAHRSRCTVAELVRQALERERQRLEGFEAARDAEVRAIQKRMRAAWKGGGSNHDFLYDENGLPIL